MVLCKQSNLIEVRRIDNRGRGGRGVFASCDVAAGTLLERIPVLLIPKNQVFGTSPEAQLNTRISWYVFSWENLTNREYVALALGYGSIYNHSFEPNAKYIPIAPDLMEIHAVRPIASGEEILINYNGDPGDKRKVEFDVH